jgi:prolyl-tRNA editing enzyme YbaK/EbsC (Cys-tRNA(Pro) deacylase)
MTTLTPPAPTMAVVPLQHSIQTKHTQTNYFVWKLQVIPYLESQELIGYVDGSIPPPPRTITGSSSNLVPNPAFRQW